MCLSNDSHDKSEDGKSSNKTNENNMTGKDTSGAHNEIPEMNGKERYLKDNGANMKKNSEDNGNGNLNVQISLRRRSKRERRGLGTTSEMKSNKHRIHNSSCETKMNSGIAMIAKKRIKSSMLKKHESDSKSGGIESLLPSLIGLTILLVIICGKMGFRGRASVAGIDLGTTNSVVCVQQQAKGVGKIDCIPDPINNSPIIPSVISFLDNHNPTKKHQGIASKDMPYIFNIIHPSNILVGQAAKIRMNSHPQHTFYHAKRVIGRTFDDPATAQLANEVEFQITSNQQNNVQFHLPLYDDDQSYNDKNNNDSNKHEIILLPHNVGSYIVNHLMDITKLFLGHQNVKTAVIAIPAKFDTKQRDDTIQAFKNAGVTVSRILEEPVAAALAYGLQKKDGVSYIMVYDFGGGTLDVSILHVSDGGYVEVMGNDGDNQLGGADFDIAIAHLLMENNNEMGRHVLDTLSKTLHNIRQNMNLQHRNQSDKNEYDLDELLSSQCEKLKDIPLCNLSSFHNMAEKMKIALSSYPNGNQSVIDKCMGFVPIAHENDSDNLERVLPKSLEDFCMELNPIQFELTLNDYNLACQSLFHRSMLPMHRLLDDLNMDKDEIDEVVMVGGTTRMPQIRDMVKQELQIDHLNTKIDPDLTVAYGAASVID